MTIHIEDLGFQCIIGILDFERVTPQDVILNVTLSYEYNEKFINYVDVRDLMKSLMINNKFFLLEDALMTLSQKLHQKFQNINTLNLKITKTSILPDCSVSLSDSFSFNS